jgi:diguanylate cyclase
MADLNSPAEIAREVFRRLTAQRIQPTPENFGEIYYQIAGQPQEEAFPERNLLQIAKALPRATTAQMRLARQFERACKDHSWPILRQQLITLIGKQESETRPWATLIHELLMQLERRQVGLNSILKRDSINRILESSATDPETLFSRLHGLIKNWSQLSSSGNVETDTDEESTPASEDLHSSLVIPLAQAPELWRDLLAETLENAVGMLLIDTPELAKEAGTLAKLLRNPETLADCEHFSELLRQFAYKVQWVAQDQSYIRNALLNLLRLIIENIGDLVIEDSYLQGQMTVLMELFSRPLNKGMLEELSERLRDVIYKQGALKHSLNEAQSRLREMFAQFIERLSELAESTGNYHSKISVFAEQITQATSLEDLASLVAVIAEETKQVERNTRRSQAELQSLRVTVDQAHKEIARLEGELEQASELVRHDPLTGTLNRKGLDEMLARETSRMRRRGSKLCLSLLDVDDFKRLNDSLGHLVGDAALKHLAAVIRENIRPQDCAGRFGGEEFLILLPDSGLEDAMNAMRRLQRELTKRIFLHDNRKVLITFSAGVTEITPDESIQEAIDRADKAMYKAKHAGKNRVEAG